MSPSDPDANRIAARDGKKDAPTLFPRNVILIDNIAEAWVTGVGRTGSLTGTGNGDWVTGGITGAVPTHPSDASQGYIAQRVVAGIAARLPVS